MLKRLLYTTAALSAPGLALTVATERLIRSRLFYTGEWHAAPPDDVRWPYEEAAFVAADGVELQGWFFKAQRADAPTLLFCHGTSYNASDMWVTEERARALHDFLRGVGCNFFVFDYRGYGRNSHLGTTEEGTYLDGAAALAWLHVRADVDPASIFFYGFSLGTGIATELALREPAAGLILRAPFTSIRAMMVDFVPRLRPLLSVTPWLPLTNYDNLAKARRLQAPLLVMHGDADETVPHHMGRRIFDAAPDPKQFATLTGSGHRDFATDLIVPAIGRFVDDVLSGRLTRTTPAAAATA